MDKKQFDLLLLELKEETKDIFDIDKSPWFYDLIEKINNYYTNRNTIKIDDESINKELWLLHREMLDICEKLSEYTPWWEFDYWFWVVKFKFKKKASEFYE